MIDDLNEENIGQEITATLNSLKPMADQVFEIPEIKDLIGTITRDTLGNDEASVDEIDTIDSTDEAIETAESFLGPDSFTLEGLIGGVDSLVEEGSSLGTLWNGFKKGALNQGRTRKGNREDDNE